MSKLYLFCIVILSIIFAIAYGRIIIELTPHQLTTPIEYEISNTFMLSASSTSYLSSTPSSISISLTNSLNRIYTGQIAIGTPPTQTFSVVFDTGSADLWVFSAQHLCQIATQCNDHTWSTNECSDDTVCCFFTDIMDAYDYNTSSTYSKYTGSSSSWSITYGKGFASGRLSKDSVTIGGLTASNQVFAEATVWSDELISCAEPMSGILGFAMKAASEQSTPTVIETLYNENQIESKLFSVSLKGNDEVSELIIGDPDPSKYTHGIVWGDIIQPTDTGMWFTQLTGILHTQHDNLTGYEWLDTCMDTAPCLALVDTGTSYITMPSSQYNKLLQYLESYTQENNANCFINTYHNEKNFICESYSYSIDDDLPYLWFQIGGYSFAISPTQYMLTGSNSCYGGDGKSDMYDCVGISSLDSMGDHTYILGDIFLRHYYLVFDESHYRIGIGSMEDLVIAIDRPPVNNIWIYVGIVAMIVGAIGVVVCVVLSFWKLNKPKSELWNRQRLIAPNNDMDAGNNVKPKAFMTANIVTIADLDGEEPNEKDKVVNVLDIDTETSVYQEL